MTGKESVKDEVVKAIRHSEWGSKTTCRAYDFLDSGSELDLAKLLEAKENFQSQLREAGFLPSDGADTGTVNILLGDELVQVSGFLWGN